MWVFINQLKIFYQVTTNIFWIKRIPKWELKALTIETLWVYVDIFGPWFGSVPTRYVKTKDIAEEVSPEQDQDICLDVERVQDLRGYWWYGVEISWRGISWDCQDQRGFQDIHDWPFYGWVDYPQCPTQAIKTQRQVPLLSNIFQPAHRLRILLIKTGRRGSVADEHYEKVHLHLTNDNDRQPHHPVMFPLQTVPAKRTRMVQEDHILSFTPRLLCALLLSPHSEK
jgi:hypothetical protein